MTLKIKPGSVLEPFGKGHGSFDDQSQVSQAVLEHLKERYPDDIIGDEPQEPVAPVEEVAPVDAQEPVEEVQPVVEEPVFPENIVEPEETVKQVNKPKKGAKKQ